MLFICIRNSARSQMAEAFMRQACPSQVYVESAGLEPGVVSPLAVATMKEVGIDISKNSTQSVFDVFKAGKLFSHVITVCDEASAAACPIFPGIVTRLNWNIPDPATLGGAWDAQLEAVRPIRQAISDKVDSLCKSVCDLVRAS